MEEDKMTKEETDEYIDREVERISNELEDMFEMTQVYGIPYIK